MILLSASLAFADDPDKPVAFRQCREAAEKLLLHLRACFVLDLEKIARSPWRYHMMASDPAEGRSASTQRSTVAGDAKPMSLEYDMRDRTHATRRARSAHY